MREQPGFETKYQASSTADDYLPFGHGSHACPGRFFAADLIKVLLAHIICNYEFKAADGKRPANSYFGIVCMPATTGLLFRERPDREDK
jgi:cytochrome P450